MKRLLYIAPVIFFLGLIILEKEVNLKKEAPTDCCSVCQLIPETAGYYDVVNFNPAVEILFEEEENISESTSLFEYSLNKKTSFCLPYIHIQLQKLHYSSKTIFFETDSSPPLV